MSYVLGSGSKLYMKMKSAPYNYAQPQYFELPFVSESLNPNADFINSNNMSVGRSTGIGEKGNVAADGSFESELSFHDLPYLLAGALGSVTYDFSSTLEGTITPNASELPVYDVVVRHGAGTSMPITFIDTQINSLKMSLVSNAVLTATVDLVGIDYSLTDAVTGEQAMDTSILMYPSVLSSLKVGAIDLLTEVVSFDFTIANNISTDLSRLDGAGRIALIPGELNITGSFEAILSGDDPLTLKTADVGTELGNIEVIFQHPTDADDYIKLTFYNVYITSISHDVNDRGVVRVNVEFGAFKDASNDPLEVEFKNTAGSIYLPIKEEE